MYTTSCRYGEVSLATSRLRLFTPAQFYNKQKSRLVTKPTKWHMRPAKTQISLDIRPVWSESSLSAWRMLGSLATCTHCAHSEDSDQTGRMPRLIWVFAGRTPILLVLSWGGSIGIISQGIYCTHTYRNMVNHHKAQLDSYMYNKTDILRDSENTVSVFSLRHKSPKGQRSLIWVQHAQKVEYGLFSNQGR